MHNIINNELIKLTRSRLFWSVLSISIVIATIDAIQNGISAAVFLQNWGDSYPHEGFQGVVLFNRWIGVNMDTIGYAWFYFLFPSLSAIPYSGAFCVEFKSGYIKQEIIRIGRDKYFLTKEICAFLAGAFSIGVALALNLLVNILFLPISKPEVLSLQTCIWTGSFLAKQFYSVPWIHSISYLITASIWAGTIALIGVACSCFVKNKIIICAFPLMLFVAIDFVVSMLVVPADMDSFVYCFSPLLLLHASAPNPNPAWLVYAEITFFLLLSHVIICRKGHMHEVY